MAGTTKSTGTIAAFERSENRFNTLRRRINLQGASDFVTPHLIDFLKIDTAVDFQDVSHILIDPSCSGSGLVAMVGETPESGEAEHEAMADESVAALAHEQTALILHAMSLPKARVIAYSTCSVHRTENEDVVLGVLAERNDWRLVQAVPQWPHRGLDLPEFVDIKDKVCRANFEKDGTNGFFVARFERSVDDAGGEKSWKKEKKKKKRKSKHNGDGVDDSAEKSSKKKSKKESSTKRTVENLNVSDGDETPVKKAAKKKKSKRRENETKEERKERKAAKKKRRLAGE
jgi:putative methyltransferase